MAMPLNCIYQVTTKTLLKDLRIVLAKHYMTSIGVHVIQVKAKQNNSVSLEKLHYYVGICPTKEST